MEVVLCCCFCVFFLFERQTFNLFSQRSDWDDASASACASDSDRDYSSASVGVSASLIETIGGCESTYTHGPRRHPLSVRQCLSLHKDSRSLGESISAFGDRLNFVTTLSRLIPVLTISIV